MNGTKANNISEQELNLQIVLKLQSLLEQSGATVILTRADANGIYELDSESIRQKKVSDMKKRVELGNNSSAHAFVSIHLNYFEQSQYSGWQTFYNKQMPESQRLAENIQKSLSDNLKKENERMPMNIKGAYIMEKVKIPAVIVECGFLSNPTESQLLTKQEYQESLTWGIYLGIQQFFAK